MDKLKRCFFTGGWDSTYMVLKYLKEGYDVQPIYAIDIDRKSYSKEIETMNKIISIIKSTTDYSDNLYNLVCIDLSTVKSIQEKNNAYEIIKSKIYIGTQYVWLSEIAQEYGCISVGIEKPSGEYSGCVEAINQFGGLKKIDGEFVIDKEKSSKVLIELMGDFVFPIIDITENEMINDIKKWEFEYIMKEIWFCHTPIKEQPCGLCRPCQQKMECNMEFLLPEVARKRFYKSQRIKKIFGEKISNCYKMIIRKFL